MTAFDFSAAETEFVHAFPLRQRAAAAYEFRLKQEHHELLLIAQEVIHEILGETNGTDLEYGPQSVKMTIDNIRFKVFIDDDGERHLGMETQKNAWSTITEIEDVGSWLSKKDCHATAPEPKNFGLGSQS